jgi:MraZ protein
MFWGEYSHHLDKKGRLIIPARYRPPLRQGAILTRGLDRNLVIYPHETWRGVRAEPSDHHPPACAAAAMFSGVVDVVDRKGVSRPVYLRQYASQAARR